MELTKIVEIIAPGQGGARQYKVVGALVSYCLTYHARGSDQGVKYGSAPSIGQCDSDAKKARKK